MPYLQQQLYHFYFLYLVSYKNLWVSNDLFQSEVLTNYSHIVGYIHVSITKVAKTALKIKTKNKKSFKLSLS